MCQEQTAICTFNFYEAPSSETLTCTHKPKFSKDEKIVKKCKNMKYKFQCEGLSETCKYNFDIAPSQQIGDCTHKIEYKIDLEISKMCSNLEKLKCIRNKYCHIVEPMKD